jgi:hypothetical protein
MQGEGATTRGCDYPSTHACALVLALVLIAPSGSQSEDKSSAPSTEALAKLAKAYEIEIVAAARFPVQTPYGLIAGTSATRQFLDRYVPLFSEEFELYPPALIKRAALKRVVLCEDLSFAGEPRGAIPDFANDTLYLDVRCAADSPRFERKAIHHEFFHIIDLRDDGAIYSDSEWAALNGVGFKYGAGGRSAQGIPTTSVLTDEYSGFLNHYSTTGVEEDKAEMFANLLVDYAYVEQRAGRDGVLRAKVERMDLLLAQFCPELNGEFWRAVKAKTRRYPDLERGTPSLLQRTALGRILLRWHRFHSAFVSDEEMAPLVYGLLLGMVLYRLST